MRTSMLAFVCLGVLSACTGDPPDTGPAADDTGTPSESLALFDDALAEDLEDALDAGLDDVGVQGMVLAVQLPDTELFLVAVGDAEDDRPLEATDRLLAASITKSFVAVVVMQLVDEGVLGLDDPLADTVDLLTRDTGITLRQLLDHTAGVPDYSQTSGFQAGAEDAWTDAELIALVADAELVAAPGATWAYSNSHYVLLGMVVEAVTGVPWHEHVDERVFGPLALGSTEAPTDDWGDVVPSYYGRQDFPVAYHPTSIGAAGAITSTAADLVRFGEAFGTGELVSASTFEEQTGDPQVLVDDAVWYGLGTLIRGDGLDDPELELGHNGALMGYAAWMGHRPGRGATMALMGNTWARDGGNVDYFYPQELATELWALVEAAD